MRKYKSKRSDVVIEGTASEDVCQALREQGAAIAYFADFGDKRQFYAAEDQWGRLCDLYWAKKVGDGYADSTTTLVSVTDEAFREDFHRAYHADFGFDEAELLWTRYPTIDALTGGK
ncbi:hypothetical protein HYV87_02035 [Candidatus Woesearchaeota archaeon]|nr:hypothetical protein [Candidatus Woesearchaeota archaeon]MBI2581891.1 hypothetical protein [Candidatus Woesearchaeota archaeon]